MWIAQLFRVGKERCPVYTMSWNRSVQNRFFLCIRTWMVSNYSLQVDFQTEFLLLLPVRITSKNFRPMQVSQFHLCQHIRKKLFCLL